jgi:hypothetical protein
MVGPALLKDELQGVDREVALRAVLQVANLPEPKWDSNGNRISPPHRSVFPRDAPTSLLGRIVIEC